MTARDDLVRLSRAAVERVDAVFRDLARRVVTFTRAFGPITNVTLPAYRAGLRRILAPVFGASRATVRSSLLYQVIVSSMAQAAVVPLMRTGRQIATMVRRARPDLAARLDRAAARQLADDRAHAALRERLARQGAPAIGGGADDGFLDTWGVVAGQEMSDKELATFLLHGPHVERARLQRATDFDPERRWVANDGYALSDRVWQQGSAVRGAIDERLRQGIASGEDALSIATDLDRYLNPEFAPLRYLQDGRIMRRNMTLAPGRGGWGGTASRRLARTEISRVHADATTRMAKNTLGVTGLKWSLSGRHPKPDECDRNANADNGHGRGVYTPQDVPRCPSHSNCLCLLSPVTMDRQDAIDAIIREYGDAPTLEMGAGGAPHYAPASFRDWREAETWAKQNLRSYVRTETFQKADITVVRDLVNSVAEFEARTGKRVPAVIEFSAKNMSRTMQALVREERPNMVMRFRPTLTPDTFKEAARYNGAEIAAGRAPWAVTDNVRATFWHEAGHTIDNVMGKAPRKWIMLNERKYPDIAKISQYSRTDQAETWAEAFAAYAVGSPQLRYVPDPLLRMIEEFFTS